MVEGGRRGKAESRAERDSVRSRRRRGGVLGDDVGQRAVQGLVVDATFAGHHGVGVGEMGVETEEVDLRGGGTAPTGRGMSVVRLDQDACRGCTRQCRRVPGPPDPLVEKRRERVGERGGVEVEVDDDLTRVVLE